VWAADCAQHVLHFFEEITLFKKKLVSQNDFDIAFGLPNARVHRARALALKATM